MEVGKRASRGTAGKSSVACRTRAPWLQQLYLSCVSCVAVKSELSRGTESKLVEAVSTQCQVDTLYQDAFNGLASVADRETCKAAALTDHLPAPLEDEESPFQSAVVVQRLDQGIRL